MPVNFKEITRRRIAKDLTQEAAGELAKFGKGELARIRWNVTESGRRPDLKISTLDIVANVLECKVADLLSPLNRRNRKAKRSN